MDNQNGLYQSIFNDICSIRPILLSYNGDTSVSTDGCVSEIS